MARKLLRSIVRTSIALLVLAGFQATLRAQSVEAQPNSIVGVWDVQVTNSNCSTGVPLVTFKGLHKYELGGTAQVVPSSNPGLQSAHMGIWRHIQKNQYQLSFKMFRFDAYGNNIGWVVVRNNVAISDDANAYAGSGQADLFDSNGTRVATVCPTFMGTRFQ